jgi:hypothetical protein
VGQQKVRESKPFRPESPGKPEGTLTTEPKPLTPEMTMHSDVPAQKVGGRLSREDQRRLGDILQRVYDDVVRQGVPERFKDLLGELDRRGEIPRAGAMGENENPDSVARKSGLGGSRGSAQ